MNELTFIPVLLVGLALLTVGAELLVRSASRLAAAMGISPLVVGLTVVAYGTSAPELVVSAQSTLAGRADVALGNVVGSNIFNVLFILGVSALIVPLRVSQRLIRIDVPLMVVLSIAVMVLAVDRRIGRIDGLLLTAGLVCHTAWTIVQSRRGRTVLADNEAEPESGRPQQNAGTTHWTILKLIAGLGLLILGSQWFVRAAIEIARQLGVSELVIGLTIVAAGTSLPEVATSIMAAIRGERDIAVGNVVGSNIFNIVGVLGISGLLSADGIAVSDAAFRLDIPVMIVVAFSCLPVFFTGHMIARWEGGLFLAYYCAYTGYLITATAFPSLTRTFAGMMLGFVAPLTALTLVIGSFRALRADRRSTPDCDDHGRSAQNAPKLRDEPERNESSAGTTGVHHGSETSSPAPDRPDDA